MSSPVDPLNPYASPFGGQAARWPGQANAGLPAFAKVMFIIDLVFCGLRIPIVLIGRAAPEAGHFPQCPPGMASDGPGRRDGEGASGACRRRYR